ncbi:interferon regulatory factor 7 isoform X2 [Tiliqua scincoides]|uniref:interferon regulatory factor 7 isoform X2 n=1 Tax=Tiliqua scincoides TaxID=71010 RepID=UPI003461FCE7
MSALANERCSQRVRFFDWLIKEIDSGSYDGLRWEDDSRTTFRIPWKHNARKSLVANDYKIFQAWALVSGKYVEALPDPAKWKTNFRCALKSTRRFELVSESKDPDPHHVYRIRTHFRTAADSPADTTPSDHRSDHEDDQLHVSPYSDGLPTLCQPTHQIQPEIDVAFETLSLGNPVPVLTGNSSENFYQCSRGGAVQWPVHHLPPDKRPSPNLSEQVAWVPNPFGGSDNPTGSATYEPDYSYIVPHIDQNGCLPLGNRGLNGPVENDYSMWPAQTIPNVNSHSAAIHVRQHTQDSPGTNPFNLGETQYNNCLIENVFMNEEAQGYQVEMNNPTRNGCWLPMNEHAVANQDMFVSPTVPSPADQPLLIAPLQNNTGFFSLNLDVTIYYKGKLLVERHVEASACMFANDNCSGSTLDTKDAQIIKFPNPETLHDRNQVKHTLTLLQNASLQLYQKNEKICARRLGRCKVFLAFSKQLENMDQDPQSRLLPRIEETEIFNYRIFFTELKDFFENRRSSSPDYTIYLCFGQCFSSAKPKESKLILVKLVPKLCKSWHEQAQKEGASSLSENMSLQISNSIPDMLEEILSLCKMQVETC